MKQTSTTSTDKNIVERGGGSRSRPSYKTLKKVRDVINATGSRSLRFEHDLLSSFAGNHINAFYIIVLYVLAIVVVGTQWFAPILLFIWGISILAAYGAMIYFCKRFAANAEPEVTLGSWRRRLMLTQLLIGFGWAYFASLALAPFENVAGPVYQFSVLLVMIAMTTMLSYDERNSVLFAATPPVVVLGAIYFVSLQPALVVMAAMISGALVFFYFLSVRFESAKLNSLALQAEKDELIAELETANSISDEARRRAEDANMAKSRFLATMSHELRTPLNAILGFSEVMKDEVLGPIKNDNYKAYVGDIHSSGQHLLNLINEILDLSRVEAGRFDLTEVAVNLEHVAEQAQNMVQLRANNKNIKIDQQIEANLPLIWADEKAVRQVLLNLLSNAIKFTPSGGTITIKVGWTRGGGQYISVIDTGPGIPKDEIPVVLSSFGQGSIAIKSAEEGAGLGLPIVQALMHMHDGKFELKSELRKGTEAVALFPRARVMEIMPPVPQSVDEKNITDEVSTKRISKVNPVKRDQFKNVREDLRNRSA